MNISGDLSLINPSQVTLLKSISACPFNFGGFSSLEDILDQCGVVDVIIEAGKPKMDMYRDLHDIENQLKEHWKKWHDIYNKLRNQLPDDFYAKGLEYPVGFDIDTYERAQMILEILGYQEYEQERYGFRSMHVRGLYDPDSLVIKLFPENMMDEYGGTKMDELLVSTLAHEVMHAYFDRPDVRRSYPYNYLVEEPMAEFGMLYYLSQTNPTYYKWAFNDVSGKRTCYRYGEVLMSQYLKEGIPSKTLDFLVEYKIDIDPYDVLIPDVHNRSVINLPAGGRTWSKLYPGGSKINWKRVFGYNITPPLYFYDENKNILHLTGYWQKTKQITKHVCLMAGGIEFTGKTTYEIEIIKGRSSLVPEIHLDEKFNMDDDCFELQDLLFSSPNVVVSWNNKDISPIKPGEQFFKVNIRLLKAIKVNRFVKWEGGKFGVIDENLNEVLKCEYDEIPVANDDGTYTVVKDGKTNEIKE